MNYIVPLILKATNKHFQEADTQISKLTSLWVMDLQNANQHATKLKSSPLQLRLQNVYKK